MDLTKLLGGGERYILDAIERGAFEGLELEFKADNPGAERPMFAADGSLTRQGRSVLAKANIRLQQLCRRSQHSPDQRAVGK